MYLLEYPEQFDDISLVLQEQIARKNESNALGDVLRKQIDEKRYNDKGLQELYANIVAPAYFSQFETSHR